MFVRSLFKQKKKPPLESRFEIERRLGGTKMPQKTLAPIEVVDHGLDDIERQFVEQTKWLQPVLNQTIGGQGARFHEMKTQTVTLGTYDMPEFGRNFEVTFGSENIGLVSVVPSISPDPENWAELRVRLYYPVEILSGDEVHGLLTGMVELTQKFDPKATYETQKRDPRASEIASRAMVKAMWDKRPSQSLVIDMNTEGPWEHYKRYVNHWKQGGIDPWEKWERE
jgi:hypothetical protein